MFYVVRDSVLDNVLDVTCTGPGDGVCVVHSSHRVKSKKDTWCERRVCGTRHLPGESDIRREGR